MTNPYRAMCAELLLFSEEAGEICMNESLWPKSDPNCTLLDRARALLAQPVAEGPSDKEVDAWADQQEFIRGHGDHPCGFWIDDGDAGALVRAALTRWGNSQGILDSSPQSEPEGPSDEELDEFTLFWWGSDTDERTVTDVIECCSMAAYVRDVLAKWGPR